MSTEGRPCGGAHEISGIKPHLFSVGGWGGWWDVWWGGGSHRVVGWGVGVGVCGVLVRDAVGGGGRVGGGMGDGV